MHYKLDKNKTKLNIIFHVKIKCLLWTRKMSKRMTVRKKDISIWVISPLAPICVDTTSFVVLGIRFIRVIQFGLFGLVKISPNYTEINFGSVYLEYWFIRFGYILIKLFRTEPNLPINRFIFDYGLKCK